MDEVAVAMGVKKSRQQTARGTKRTFGRDREENLENAIAYSKPQQHSSFRVYVWSWSCVLAVS